VKKIYAALTGPRSALLLIMVLASAVSDAYEMRVSELQLQQALNERMPLIQQRGIFTLTLTQPQLTLLKDHQRAQIRAHARVVTRIGLQSQGMVTVDGKVRYQKDNYSFFIDDARVTELDLKGLSASLQPQLISILQNAVVPEMEKQPVYTLSDQEMTQAMARMMLQDVRIEGNEVVLELNPF
tara:strand:+ start:109177 stop:109725 length:549 start_codon:yes stop_codon:yes gene_type:complete